MNNPIDSTSPFDSRDLIEYKEYLEEEIVNYYNEYLEDYNLNVDEDEQEEEINTFDEIVLLDGFVERFKSEYEHCESVIAFCEELGGSADFVHGETIISEDYFTEYSEELCKEIGEISSDLPWYIANHIDWDGVAGELKVDYIEVDFEGTTYLIRA